MYLESIRLSIEQQEGTKVQRLARAGIEVPGILYLLAARPEFSRPLNELCEAIMRGPGELPVWQRELIAALTSRCNDCGF